MMFQRYEPYPKNSNHGTAKKQQFLGGAPKPNEGSIGLTIVDLDK